MIIINQDRDKSYQLNSQEQLHIAVNTYENKVIGYSVLLDKEQIGTFDSLMETLKEVSNICSCKYDYYIINGFSDYLKCVGG